MKRIGITGGIGSGKSTVCKVLSKLGVPVYSADDKAKFLISANTKLQTLIIENFGSESFTMGNYNTAYISSQVFHNPQKLSLLNSIIHPFVHDNYEHWCEKNLDNKYTLFEAAILFENNFNQKMDGVIVVNSPRELRIKRVHKRDNLSKEEIEVRINNQAPADRINAIADWVIENNYNQLLLPQIIQIHKELTID